MKLYYTMNQKGLCTIMFINIFVNMKINNVVLLLSMNIKFVGYLTEYVQNELSAVVTTNPCATNKGGCSDICVPHSGDNFTCMCPDGSGKLPVNKMCQGKDQILFFQTL